MKITQRGQGVLAGKLASLTLKDLDQSPEHFNWHHKKAPNKPGGGNDIVAGSDTLTPEERINSLTSDLNSLLAEELLSQVRAMDPYKFEQLVVDLLFAMGYFDDV